jgi:hypothetical protein
MATSSTGSASRATWSLELAQGQPSPEWMRALTEAFGLHFHPENERQNNAKAI